MEKGSPDVHSRNTDGFSLIEVLVAMALLAGALASVAQIVVLVSASTMAARHATFASVLAAQKLSQLHSQPLTELGLSAPDAWMRSTPGFVEFLNGGGESLGWSDPPPANTIYVRRWSVTPLAGDPAGGVVLQVSTGPLRWHPEGSSPETRSHELARVVGVKTRLVP